MKRFSPVLIVAALAAVLAALMKGNGESLPAESWKPVDPS